MTKEFYSKFKAEHSDRSKTEIDYFVSRFNKMIDDNPGCSERQIANNLLAKLSGHKKWGGLSNQREDFASRTKVFVESNKKGGFSDFCKDMLKRELFRRVFGWIVDKAKELVIEVFIKNTQN